MVISYFLIKNRLRVLYFSITCAKVFQPVLKVCIGSCKLLQCVVQV